MFKKFSVVLAILVVFVFGGAVGFIYSNKVKIGQIKGENRSKYIVFIDEVYGVIKDNYWNKIEDEQLNNIFVLASEKITNQAQNPKVKNRQELLNFLDKLIEAYDSEDKKSQFMAALADMVLSNLEPFGRSRLYSQKDEKALSDNVTNKSNEDRYQALGVSKEADEAEIKEAYEVESNKWDPKTNSAPEAKENYEKIQQAYKVLSDKTNKEIYDVYGIEPTMDYKLMKGGVFYIHLKKFSPTTFDELKRVSEKVDENLGVDSLIFDLRDNIGGAIDGLPYFLGPFIGYDQYAYQFLHQGVRDDYKTKVGWLPGLVKYKKVVVLINENSQSTAEVMAASLKKYNVGILVGRKTKGWGTVEKVFNLKSQINENEAHSVFLVHSITLRDDGQAIEGRGVEPKIDIDNKNWDKELLSYFNYPDLIKAVKEVLSQ